MAKVKTSNAAPANQDSKAVAYINISLKKTDGSKIRLGQFGLGLFADRAMDSYVMQRVHEGMDINELLQHMELSITFVGEEKAELSEVMPF